jgi:hypothetical protein
MLLISKPTRILANHRRSRHLTSTPLAFQRKLTVQREPKKLAFAANLGDFPAYEAYAQLGNGPVVTVFRAPPVINTPWESPLAKDVPGLIYHQRAQSNDFWRRAAIRTSFLTTRRHRCDVFALFLSGVDSTWERGIADSTKAMLPVSFHDEWPLLHSDNAHGSRPNPDKRSTPDRFAFHSAQPQPPPPIQRRIRFPYH